MRLCPATRIVLAAVAEHGPMTLLDLERMVCGGRPHSPAYLYALERWGYVTWTRDRFQGEMGMVAVTPGGLGALGRPAESSTCSDIHFHATHPAP